MKALLAIATVALLAGCAYNSQCVQPDPVQPSSKCWNQGVDCGTGIQAYGAKAAK